MDFTYEMIWTTYCLAREWLSGCVLHILESMIIYAWSSIFKSIS